MYQNCDQQNLFRRKKGLAEMLAFLRFRKNAHPLLFYQGFAKMLAFTLSLCFGPRKLPPKLMDASGRNAHPLHRPYALDLGNYLQSLWTRASTLGDVSSSRKYARLKEAGILQFDGSDSEEVVRESFR
ncbi:4970_t:CDS:2 [Funneliformis mosseae]|uniref:4970_t:CDS:1 n=1 Tax=Funneliformis mosseae TaxID=27381 RepID=A0A9N9G0S2_FUNMO|nr:4970_t:CDS:2 [Funneliformis mosseae]